MLASANAVVDLYLCILAVCCRACEHSTLAVHKVEVNYDQV